MVERKKAVSIPEKGRKAELNRSKASVGDEGVGVGVGGVKGGRSKL